MKFQQSLLLRLLARLLPVLVCGFLGTACVSPPDAQALLDVGFRSPKQTFRSFQTALAADVPSLEYRCLSEGFRSRNELSQHVYRRGREELLKKKPYIKLLANAEIESSETIDEHRVVLTVLVDVKVAKRRFQVRLVRDDAIELYGSAGEQRGRLLFDDYRDFDSLTRVIPMDNGEYEVIVIASEIRPYGNTDLGQVSEVRVLQDWKIDEFFALDPSEENP